MERQQQHAKVERFLKLGYATADILRVLESLHHDAQTNDILEELIKTCHARGHGSAPSSPKLVPRGCSPGPGRASTGPEREPGAGFRPVVIDGSNVAMSHGDKKVFSCQGLQLAVSWFWDKGLRDITVFVPLWRKEQPRPEAPITDQHILHELERRKILVYTPSRCVNGKRVVCYDDRYIIKLAVESNGIIVSNDNYRDLQTENPQWKKFIEERLLMYTFANDKFMPPDDPLGRNGPTIDDFLRKKPWTPETKQQQQQHCPYGKKCTYGIKCKFYHPERANQSQLAVADELRALAHQPEHRYTPPTPPYGSRDDLTRGPWEGGGPLLYPYQSSEDEAFGSLGSSLSRLSVQDPPYASLTGYSSGRGSYQTSGSHPGSSMRVSPGGHSYYSPLNSSGCCDCHMCGPHPHHHHPLQGSVWSSCPALPPPGSRPPAALRQSRSMDPWAPSGPAPAPPRSSQQRSDLRSELSALYPQSVVEQVLNAHPHVSNRLELIGLLQSHRSSNLSF